MPISDIVDLDRYPLDAAFGAECAAMLDRNGVLVLPDFIRAQALEVMQSEANAGLPDAYFCAQNHSVYLTPHNDAFPADHAANRQVVSSKGCICDDMVAQPFGASSNKPQGRQTCTPMPIHCHPSTFITQSGAKSSAGISTIRLLRSHF